MASENEIDLKITIEGKDAERFLKSFKKTTDDTAKSNDKLDNSLKKLNKTADDNTKAIAKSNKALKEKIDSSKLAESGVSNIGSSLARLAGPLVAAIAGFAGLRRAIKEAVDDEREIRQLSFALASTGEFSVKAREEIVKFADELGNITGIDPGVIVQQVVLAKTFGATNEQAVELVKASVKLSAVTGKDLETSTRLLGKAMDGTIGKLADLGPEYRNLTKAQLEAGEANRILNERLKGADVALGDSFEGQLGKLQNVFNDVFTVIGKQIIGDPQILGGINSIGKALKDLSPILIDTVKIFVLGFKTIAGAASLTAGALAKTGAFGLEKLESLLDFLPEGNIQLLALKKGLKVLGVEETAKQLRSFGDTAFDAGDGFLNFEKAIQAAESSTSKLDGKLQETSDNAKKAGKALSESALKAIEDFKKLQQESAAFIDNILVGTGDEIEVVAKKAGESLARLQKIQSQGADTPERIQKAREAVIADSNDKILKIETDRINKQLDAEKKAAEFISNLIANNGDSIEVEANKAAEALQKITEIEESGAVSSEKIQQARLAVITEFNEKAKKITDDRIAQELKAEQEKNEQIASFFSGAGEVTSQVFNGEEGAKAFVSGVSSKIADVFAPGTGIGAFVGPLVSALANGGDFARDAIKEFIQAVPEIIDKVVESVPIVVETLVDTLINKGGIIRIGAAFTRAVINIGPLIAVGIRNQILDGAPIFGRNVANAFKEFTGEFFAEFGAKISENFKILADQFVIIREFFSGFVETLRSIFDPLLDALQALKSALENADPGKAASKIGGAVGDVVKSVTGVAAPIVEPIAKVFGFSEGGEVPQIKLPSGDRLLAGFNPGELVVPTDTVGDLKQFLADQNSPTGGGSNEAMLVSILRAVQAPIVVQAEAKVNQSAFADIILQLNRQNARLA